MKLSISQTQRYARQILLNEVGARGQLRLLATSVRVDGTGAAAEEATRYLVAAGVGTVVVEADLLGEHGDVWADLNEEVALTSVGPGAHTIELDGSSSRLEGARAALRLLVAVGVEAQA